MNARTTILILLLASAAVMALAGCDQFQRARTQATREFPVPEPDYDAKLALDFAPFDEALRALGEERRADLDEFLADATILEIQERFRAGSLTSEELTVYYLDRIRRYDVGNFNSVLALNPDALEDAKARDSERERGGEFSAMHGIPILMKDNIAIKGLPTAAGAYAMKDWTPERDAAVAAAVRESGAVILGKANLSEWANWMDDSMPSGFSALGGQTRNPYGPFEVFGSSSGSAVAAAAGFAVVTIGSETQGSLLRPASINSVVGLKPTHSLVSGDYIIPLMPFQDNAGPIARNVTDVAILFGAMVSPDTNDSDAMALEGRDFLGSLAPDATRSLRLGMVGQNDELQTALEQRGLTVIAIDSKDLEAVPPDREVFSILPPVFKYAIDGFLPAVGAPVGSLAEIIAINEEDMSNRAPYGQGNLEKSRDTALSEEETADRVAERIKTYSDALTALFDEYDVDVMFISDDPNGIPLGQAYAPAGWPAMVVPAGYTPEGQPISFGFVARPYEDGKMLTVAYAVEQITQAYRPPNLEATIQMLDERLGDEK